MSALELIAQHILDQLSEKRPLFVALQGPQGSGKSYLSARLQTYLQTHCSLRVIVFSIDDLYLSHQCLTSLAAFHSSNTLWQGRGQPGTHDVDLGVEILSALKTANKRLELPRFDKSLFGGEGDRLPMDGNGTVVEQPPAVDVVVFEGWCVGFHPISEEELLARWNGVWKREKVKLGLGKNQTGRLEDVKAINEKLQGYLKLWNFFDVLVRLRAIPPANSQLSQYAIVYKWRLEQEHDMKARNGGQGLTDAAVKSFVDRYIPGYVFFGDVSPPAGEQPQHIPVWAAKALTLTLDEARKVTEVSTF
jgi:D-glycerate 3-kinase